MQAHREDLLQQSTGAEKRFAKILDGLGIRYTRQKAVSMKSGYTFFLDFYLPEYLIGIEIDGKYHQDPKQKQKDAQRTSIICSKKLIRKIVRFQNKEVRGNREAFEKKLITAICPPAAKFMENGKEVF